MMIIILPFIQLCLGFGFIAYAPFAYESLVETTFPIDEGMAVAMMINFAQLSGFVLNEVTILPCNFSGLRLLEINMFELVVGNHGYWFLTIITLPVILYGVFGFKTDYRRTKSEARESMKEHGEPVPGSDESVTASDQVISTGEQNTTANKL